MQDILAAQRAAFTAALPEPLSTRKDRLRRAAAMIRDHADRFCDALSEDFGHRSREQTMMTDIAGSIAPRSSTSTAGPSATSAPSSSHWACSAPEPGSSISPRASSA